MQITITIDASVPLWLKKLATVAGIPAVLAIATVVHADVPVNTFQPGDPLSSTKMNDNFKALKDAIDAMEVKSVAPKFGTFPEVTNPTCGGSATHPNGAAAIAFSLDGLYKVTLGSRASHGTSFTDVGMGWVIAGTASRLDTMGDCGVSAPAAPQSADGTYACVGLFRANAGETITLLPSYRVACSAGPHAFNFTYLVERIGD